MNRLTAVLTVLSTSVVLSLGAGPAFAAPPTEDSPVVTLDPTGVEDFLPELEDSATDWSKNTDVDVVVAPCTGDNCVHFEVVDNPCPSGDVTFGLTLGCAHASSDPEACQVDLNDYLYSAWWTLRLYAIKHEIGHCVYWLGGAGFIHLDSERALMKDGFSGTPSAQNATLTTVDRKFAQELPWGS